MKMSPIKVTVTSDIAEFAGALHINQEPIEPDVTWAALFQLHGVRQFNPDRHCIKSTKNVAYAQDSIQETSGRFRVKSIKVKIVPLSGPRPQMARRGSGRASPVARGRGSRGRGSRGQRTPPINRTPIQNPIIPGPSSARPRQVEMNGRREATFSSNRGGASSSASRPAGNLPRGSMGRGRASGPGRSQGQGRFNAQRPGVFDFPEDGMSGGSRPGQPILDHLSYAASIASEDEDDEIRLENPADSDLKARVLREIGRVPNGDFDSILQELRNLINGEQRYRWLRKAPMAGSLLLQAFNV